MAKIIEYLGGETLITGLVKEQTKKKIIISASRGRTSTVTPDKVLFHHVAASVEALQDRVEALQQEVDVPLLWESLQGEEAGAMEAQELARLYFDEDSDAHSSALFRALVAERLHFRRRGKAFEPRSESDLQRIRDQRAAEERAARQSLELDQALEQEILDDALARRLEAFIRGQVDRQLLKVLEQRFSDPARGAFERLLSAGWLPPTASLEALLENLQQELSPGAMSHAESLEPTLPCEAMALSAFTIDDEETQEVDDALSISQDGLETRVDIDIADVASLVTRDDPVDREAVRRASTVYLPTEIFYMLPHRIGCELGSLHAEQVRPVLRTSVWLDEEGHVKGYELSRASVRVQRRLDYHTADRMIADHRDQSSAAEALRSLHEVAQKRAALRRARGALFLQRREWKIRVSKDGEELHVHPIDHRSPSRALVAEMMILANSLAAREACQNNIPIIYRTQKAPPEPLPEVDLHNPAAFEVLRGRIKPAAWSLHPSEHWGLGLDCYTQVSSPLRRYADLVMQRQLTAALEDRPPPYNAEELLEVLATVEATERSAKRMEAAVKEQWALEYVARQDRGAELETVIMREHPAGGYLTELSLCGAHGILVDDRRHEAGEALLVTVKTVKPRKGVLRLLPVG